MGSEGSRGRWLWTNFIKMCRDSPGPPPEPRPENNIPLWCSETIRGQIRDSGAEHSPASSCPGVNIQFLLCYQNWQAKCFLVGTVEACNLLACAFMALLCPQFAINGRCSMTSCLLLHLVENCLYGGREQEAIPWRIKSRVLE